MQPCETARADHSYGHDDHKLGEGSLSLAAYPNPHASPLAQRARKAETGPDAVLKLAQRTRRTTATRTAAGPPAPGRAPGVQTATPGTSSSGGSNAPPAARKRTRMPGTITTRPPETGRYKRKASQDEPGRGPPQYLKRRRNHEPVSPGRPSVAPIQKKTRATGVDGTSQRLASSESRGPRPRLKVRASPGAEAGDLHRESDRGSRPRPPPGGLGGPRRPETRRRIPEQAAAGRAR